MKNFFKILLSDSNKVSVKRVIGLICLLMFISYGIVGLLIPFNEYFWIFYVSLCMITIWISFKYITADKILKYDVISKLSKFAPLKEVVTDFIGTESDIDDAIQPELTQEITELTEPKKTKKTKEPKN